MHHVIREPHPAEASALADLHVSIWQEAYAHLVPEGFFTPDHVEARHRMWERMLRRPREGSRVRVADVAGDPVGFASVGTFSPGADDDVPRRHLFALYLSAPHRGTGAAQALLDATLGPGPATLWVARENPRAIAFYTRNGFREDGAEKVDPSTPSLVQARMVR